MASKKTQWRGIKTAPKDGTYILTIGGKTDEDHEYVSPLFSYRPVVCYWYIPSNDESHRDPEWRFSEHDGSWYGAMEEPPTHWMLIDLPENLKFPRGELKNLGNIDEL